MQVWLWRPIWEGLHRSKRWKSSQASINHHNRIDITDEQFLEGWNSVFVGEVEGIYDVVTLASIQYPLYVFSNTNAPHQIIWRGLCPKLLSKFQKIFVSCELGWRKPEKDAFYTVAKAIGKPIHQILFFDDTPENVAIASRLGMQIVEVKSFRDVKERLEFLLWIQERRCFL